jgi:hypothetical protein
MKRHRVALHPESGALVDSSAMKAILLVENQEYTLGDETNLTYTMQNVNTGENSASLIYTVRESYSDEDSLLTL